VCLAGFNVKKSSIIIIQQHLEIAAKGSAPILQGIKEALAALAADIMKLMQVLTGKKSGWWRNPPSAEILLAFEEKIFMAQCRLIYNTANRMLVTLEDKGLTLHTVNTFKTAIDVYNAVIPAPKATKNLERSYTNTLKMLFGDTDKMLLGELDPAMFEAAKGKPEFLSTYKKIRGLKK
jgi:hypothetical protein